MVLGSQNNNKTRQRKLQVLNSPAYLVVADVDVGDVLQGVELGGLGRQQLKLVHAQVHLLDVTHVHQQVRRQPRDVVARHDNAVNLQQTVRVYLTGDSDLS